MSQALSVYLNLLRFLAALAVYLFHAQWFARFSLPYIGNFGSEAVLVFFVLSGVLITSSGIRQPNGRAFLRARVVRLWSVGLPALMLTMAADTIGQHILLSAYEPMQPYDTLKWLVSIVINSLFLNQVWNVNVYAGTNGPFWSLSYEFWYYIMFAGWLYFSGKKRIGALACAALIAGPSIVIGFPIWLMGSAAYFAMVRTRASTFIGWTCWLGSIAIALTFLAIDMDKLLVKAFPTIAADAKWKVDFWPESYSLGLLVAINIFGFSVIGKSFGSLLARFSQVIRLGADISFGLYLFHYPLMYLAKAILHNAGLTTGATYATIVYAAPLGISAALAIQCERHKNWVGIVIDRVAEKANTWIWGHSQSPKSIVLTDPLQHPPSSVHIQNEDKILF